MKQNPETKRKRGEDWRNCFGRVLNNFHLRFLDRINQNGGYYRRLVQENGDWELSPEQRWGSLENKNRDCGNDVKSALFWQQPHCEFYAELDRTVTEIGISFEEIADFNTRYQKEGSEEAAKALWNLLLPIYVAMRKKGYLPYDLIS